MKWLSFFCKEIYKSNIFVWIENAYYENKPAFNISIFIIENKKTIFLQLVTVIKMMTMVILAVWYNDKSVCSGLEWISIYFIKAISWHIHETMVCVYVCMIRLVVNMNIQLPNSPNWNVLRRNRKWEKWQIWSQERSWIILFWKEKKRILVRQTVSKKNYIL